MKKTAPAYVDSILTPSYPSFQSERNNFGLRRVSGLKKRQQIVSLVLLSAMLLPPNSARACDEYEYVDCNGNIHYFPVGSLPPSETCDEPCHDIDLGGGCILTDCGNSGSQINCSPPPPDFPPDEPPTGPEWPPYQPPDQCTLSEGANPISVIDGNVRRRITDLSIAGSGLVWQRQHNSIARTEFAERSLGNGGGWRHSYQYDLVSAVSVKLGEILEFDYPNGRRTFLQKQPNGSYAAPGNNPERARMLTDGGVELTTDDNTTVHFVSFGTYEGRPRYHAVSLTTETNRIYQLVRDAKGRLTEVRDPEERSLRVSYRDVALAGNPAQVVANLKTRPAPGKWLEVAIPVGVPAKSVYLRAAFGAVVADVQFFAEGSDQPLTGIPVSDYCAAALDGNPTTNYAATPARRLIGYTFEPNRTARITRVRLLAAPGSENTVLDSKVVIELPKVSLDSLAVISQVETSDGQTVRYDYEITTQGLGGQAVLTTANYGDGTAARYRYSTPADQVGGGALLLEADDPRYDGPAKHIKYSYYQPRIDDLPAGTIKAELNPSTGRAWARLEFDRADPQKRTIVYSDDRFHSYRLLADGSGRVSERADSLGRHTKLEFAPGLWGRPQAVVDEAGRRGRWTRDARGRTLSYRDQKGREQTNVRDGRGKIRRNTDSQGRIKITERDADGRIIRQVNADGSVHELIRDTKGWLIAYKGPGRDRTFAYDALGRRTSFTDKTTGATTQYSYNSRGRMETSTDALGRTTRYERNDRGLVTAITNVSGLRHVYRYDDYGRRVGETDPAGRTAEYTYDDLSRITRKVDFSGGVTTFAYAEFPGGCGTCSISKQPTRIVTPDGVATDLVYDTEGRELARTTASGTPAQATTTFAYDSDDNKISTTDPLGRVTRYTYDDDHHRLSLTDPLGRVAKWTYDDDANVLKTTAFDGAATTMTYDTFKHLLSVTDALGNTTRYTYDANDRVVSVIDARRDTTRFLYDDGDRKIATIYSDHTRQTWEYDALGNVTKSVSPDLVVTKTAYDAGNRPIKVERIIPNAPSEILSFTYDSFGHRLTATDPLGRMTKWSYDAHGNVLTVTRPDGVVAIRNEYDAQDNLITTTDAAGAATIYTYDSARNQTSITDAKGNAYHFTYDALHRKTSMVYPDASQEKWTYDLVDNQITSTTRAHQTKTIVYNAANQPLTEVWSPANAAADVFYTYDMAGRLVSIDNGQAQLSYTYDKLSRLSSETSDFRVVVPGLDQQTVKYVYDELGRRSDLIYPDHTKVSYDYDTQGRISKIDTKGRGRLPLATYAYDQAGRIANLARENKVSTVYSYDMAGRLIDITHSNGRAVLASSHYTLDTLGSRTAQTREDGIAELYGYDVNGRLTSVDYGAAKSETYAYDFIGNRTKAGRLAPNEPASSTAYVTSDLNQYTQLRADRQAVALTYDVNGNLTNDGRQISTYDAQNRLVSVSPIQRAAVPAGAQRAEFFYDARDRCVVRKYYLLSNQNEWILNQHESRALTYDTAWNLLAERTLDGAPAGEYIHGQRTDEILRADIAAPTVASLVSTYPLADGIGSTVALCDNKGEVSRRYRYDAYGAPSSLKPNHQQVVGSETLSAFRFLFTGREWQNPVRLNDHRRRYYSPNIGRWISQDPIGLKGGLNLYGYVGESPINTVDPFGLVSVNFGTLSLTIGPNGNRAALSVPGTAIGACRACNDVDGKWTITGKIEASTGLLPGGKGSIDVGEEASIKITKGMECYIEIFGEVVNSQLITGINVTCRSCSSN